MNLYRIMAAKALFTAMFSVLAYSAQAQQSTVFEFIDQADASRIEGVIFRSLERDQNAVSDGQGRISWMWGSDSTERVQISSLGYITRIEVVKRQSGPVRIFLQSEQTELSDVVITASMGLEKRAEATVSLSVLKPYLIENRGSVSIDQTLEQLPGLNIADGQANLRSGSGWSYGAGTRVQVLLDDLPLISPDAGQVQWDLLPFESASQFEVLKGAASSLYGSAALNGVIQLRTAPPALEPQAGMQLVSSVYDQPKVASHAWWGSPRTSQALRFNFSSGQSRLAYRIGGLLMNDRGYRYEEPDARARIYAQTVVQSRKVKGLAYGLDGGFMWSKSGDALLWDSRSTPYVALDSSVTLTTGSDLFLDPHAVLVRGKHTHKLRLRYLQVDNNAANRTTDFGNRSEQLMGQYVYRLEPWVSWVFQAGAFASIAESNSELFQGRHRSANSALFAQVEKAFGGLKLIGGFRWEQVVMDEEYFSRPLFRFGANAKVGPATYLRANVGEGFRFPSMAERYTSTNVGSIFVLPNPKLKPEEGVSAELGVRQELPLGRGGVYVDLAAYWMQYQNMLEFQFAQWESSPQNPVGLGFRSINTGPARISGVELEVGGQWRWDRVDFRLLSGFNWALPVALDPARVYSIDSNGNEMSYLNTSSDTSGSILKYRYERLYRFDIEARWARWTFGAGLKGNGFMRNIDGIFESPLVEILIPGVGIKESREEERAAGDDLVFDFRALYAFNSHWTLGLTIDNLGNESVQPRPAQLAPPRRFNALIRWTL